MQKVTECQFKERKESLSSSGNNNRKNVDKGLDKNL